MTAALIASLLLNALLFYCTRSLWQSASFWKRQFEGCHALFMAHRRAEASRAQAELQDSLARVHSKRRAEREWN